jgi:hypothetical protein
LRVIATTSGVKVIFKGGTSLVKGWNLIQRFSKDIDIFLDPTAFEPPLGKRGIDRELKKLSEAIGSHPALTFAKSESTTIAAFGRNDLFYRRRLCRSFLVSYGFNHHWHGRGREFESRRPRHKNQWLTGCPLWAFCISQKIANSPTSLSPAIRNHRLVSAFRR